MSEDQKEAWKDGIRVVPPVGSLRGTTPLATQWNQPGARQHLEPSDRATGGVHTNRAKHGTGKHLISCGRMP